MDEQSLRERLRRYAYARAMQPYVQAEIERRLTVRRQLWHPWLRVHRNLAWALAQRARHPRVAVFEDCLTRLAEQRAAVARAGWFN